MPLSILLEQTNPTGFLTQSASVAASEKSGSAGWSDVASDSQNTGGFDATLAAVREQNAKNSAADDASKAASLKSQKAPAKSGQKKSKKTNDQESGQANASETDDAGTADGSAKLDKGDGKTEDSKDPASKKDEKVKTAVAAPDVTAASQCLPQAVVKTPVAPPQAAVSAPVQQEASGDAIAKTEIAKLTVPHPTLKNDQPKKENQAGPNKAKASKDVEESEAVTDDAATQEAAKPVIDAKTARTLHKDLQKAMAGGGGAGSGTSNDSDGKINTQAAAAASAVDAADVSDEIQKNVADLAGDPAAKSAAPSAAPTTTISTDTLSVKQAANHAEAAPAAQETQRLDTTDPMDQVVLGLKGKFDARTGKAEIRLDPPNLGTVKVSLSLENGSLTAEFQSQSNVVRDLLKGNLDKLKTVLESQGVTVDRLNVSAPPSAAADAGAKGNGQQPSFGSPNHDGRSAGQYQQDPRSGQRQSDGLAFSRLIRQVQDAPSTPIDLVA